MDASFSRVCNKITGSSVRGFATKLIAHSSFRGILLDAAGFLFNFLRTCTEAGLLSRFMGCNETWLLLVLNVLQ